MSQEELRDLLKERTQKEKQIYIAMSQALVNYSSFWLMKWQILLLADLSTV